MSEKQELENKNGGSAALGNDRTLLFPAGGAVRPPPLTSFPWRNLGFYVWMEFLLRSVPVRGGVAALGGEGTPPEMGRVTAGCTAASGSDVFPSARPPGDHPHLHRSGSEVKVTLEVDGCCCEVFLVERTNWSPIHVH